jgi:hypothetical protein
VLLERAPRLSELIGTSFDILTFKRDRQQAHAKQKTFLLLEWVIISYNREKLTDKKGALKLLA